MMKRKIALFLAAIMVLASSPQALYAAISNNYLSKSNMSVPNYTVYYEQGYPTGNAAGSGGPVTGREGTIEYWIDGSNLVIELSTDLQNGITGNGLFKVVLENARWFFRNSNAGATVALNPLVSDEKQGITEAIAAKLEENYGTGVAEVTGTTGSQTLTAKAEAVTTDFSGTGLPGGLTSTYNPAKGVYNDNKYFRLNGGANEVQYMLMVSAADDTTATVVVLGKTDKANQIVIPLCVRTLGNGTEVRVNITDSATGVANGSFLLATGAEGRTRTTAASVVTSRTDFGLKDIIIKEQRMGSIKNGATFELSAPSGYYFDISGADVYTELGLTWNKGTKNLSGVGDPTSDYRLAYKQVGTRPPNESIIEVTLNTVVPSTSITGAVYITGLALVAEDMDNVNSGQELNLTIRDTSNTRSITDETFLVAKVSDYAVSMSRTTDTIPELVSGRMDAYTIIDSTGYDSEVTLSDADHRAATVRIAESIPNAWWASRTTELTLPEGVRVLKARFSNVTNLATPTTLTTNTGNTANTSEFFNTGTRVNGALTIKDNNITISRLTVNDSTSKARFDISLWLNLDVEFEGDIDMTLTGTAITGEADNSITIAKAVKPVEVKTALTDIKVGYQYISVGDFEITETKAGNLLQGESVYVSVTDEISVDMSIARGFTAEVSEGNLRISNILTQSALGYTGETIEGQLRFDIDRSSTQASTIRFTNVQVKVDRSVPYSNISNDDQRGIYLVVWGPAIAANYEGLMSSIRQGLASGESLNTRDFFATPGVRARYINVTTAATGQNNEFSNVVRVTIGNPVIQIGEQEYTMPVAPYISVATNSTMMPIRFIANALGLSEDRVKWDDALRTVTIDAGTRIVQFQVGNPNYLVNGVSVPMLNQDGMPVAMEIMNDRAFVPFRALGNAFNIAVDWDSASNTATYNAPVRQ